MGAPAGSNARRPAPKPSFSSPALWFLITQGDHAFNHATLDEVFGHFQAAETTVQRLLKAEPDAPRSQRDLSVSYNKIGDVQRAQGDLSSALSSYPTRRGNQTKAGRARSGQHRLAARSVGQLRKDQRIGDVQRAQGDLSSALSSYQQRLEIRQKLTARDPANAQCLLFLGKRCCESWLPFSFKWQPISQRKTSSPADGVRTSLLHPPLSSPLCAVCSGSL